MMPPHCVMCEKDGRRNPDEKFKLVRFKLTPEEAEMKQRMKDQNLVGHPPGAHWFCEQHSAAIEPYKHLDYDAARAEMNKPKGFWDRWKARLRMAQK